MPARTKRPANSIIWGIVGTASYSHGGCDAITPNKNNAPAIDANRVKKPSSKHTPTAMVQTPVGRSGTPDEVAALALFLASEESTYCTGAEFVADGGATPTHAYYRR